MAALAQRATPAVAAAALAAAISVSGSAAYADPPGNNGTVKIAGVGDIDRIPNNMPHQSCTFTVQWYGFDKGPDIVSHVLFTAHAPTAGVTLTVDGPSTVFVGGDPATGAGTPTGLDGTATYTLSFSGGSAARQGYHVRLDVTTPHSLGNDTKSKMFWVGPCAAPPGPPPSTPPPSTPPPATPPSTPPPATPPSTPPLTAPSAPPFAAGNLVPLSQAAQTKTVSGKTVTAQGKQVTAPTVISSGETAPRSWSAARWAAAGLGCVGAVLTALGGLLWRRRGV